MKRLLTLILSASLLASCSQKQEDGKAKLERLKSEVAKLNDEIRTLEEELAKKDPASALKGAREVMVEKLTATDFNSYIEVQGVVDARQSVEVSAKAPGTVTAVLVKEGQMVRKGQVLARLDDEVITKGIAELKNQMTFVNQLYDKQKALWDQKIGTEVQFLQAKNNKEALELKLASLKEQAAMMTITAPIDGSVDLVYLKVGQMASPGFPAIRVVNEGDMRLIADIAESYNNQVKVGNPVLVRFNGENNDRAMKLDFIGRVIDPMNRTFRTEIMLGGIAGIKPNMTAALKINDFKASNAISISSNLIQNHGDGNFVFVVGEKDGKKIAVRRMITTGKTYGGKTLVVSGLQAGDPVITRGHTELNEGQLIRF